MISEATIRATKCWPELHPNAGVVTINAGIISAPQLNLQQFRNAGVWGRMGYMLQPANANISMKITVDDEVTTLPLVALRNNIPEAFDLEARNYLDFVFSSPVLVNNHPWYHNLWFYQPTVAHKIARGVPLDDEEGRIAKDLGLYALVEKGTHPHSLIYQILREYRVITENTRTRSVPLTPGIITTLDVIRSREGEAVVLTGFSCTTGILNDITLYVDRDKDNRLIDGLLTFPMTPGQDNPVFIPAVRELEVMARSVGGLGAGGFNLRYTVRRIKLTNILRARWGLAAKDELPGDLWAKVKGGIV